MFRQAERKQAKLRLGITGPSGSGKTMGALYIAAGLGGQIAMIDTEAGSGELYANLPEVIEAGGYLYDRLEPPFTPERYVAKMKEAEKFNVDTLIIDSASHAWEGTGGILDMHDRVSAGSKNSFAAWREVTPKHNQFVDAMLRCPYHLIVTMRSKSDYLATTDGSGRMQVRKVGMAPIQRPGMEYEFTTIFDLDMSHQVSVFSGKDRTSLFDGKAFILSPNIGRELAEWLDEGIDLIQSMEPIFKGFMGEIEGLEQGNLDGLREWWAYRKETVESLLDIYKQRILQELTQKKVKKEEKEAGKRTHVLEIVSPEP